MPVPTGRFEQQAHRVVKPVDQSIFSLPRPTVPEGPPFGTRDAWLASLPAWRRTKDRSYSQDFPHGLALAENAPAIKGQHAQACIPPQFLETAYTSEEEADDEMSEYSPQYNCQSQWSATSSPNNVDQDMDYRSDEDEYWGHSQSQVYNEMDYEKGAFSPIFEDESPDPRARRDVSSSPVGPATPFGDYVDRAYVSDAAPTDYPSLNGPYGYQEPQCVQAPVYEVVEKAKEQPVPDYVVTPSASTEYKKLADPLSQWMSDYVWKVCTSGMGLPLTYAKTMGPARQYLSTPPAYLASSVHSLLLSTLLQPSAVMLALWYITRLPVYFGGAASMAEQPREYQLRLELFGETRAGPDRDALETNAPFRLIVLGCMMANKWLDDHTFSNKTWHTISNIPVQAVNKLESLALDLFAYDLNVSPRDWSQWLGRIQSYHLSLSSPYLPQPISRPSSNPHSIIRRAVEDLIQAPSATHSLVTGCPEPVFLGVEERRAEKLEREAAVMNVHEIDLDEDGPLRQEYLPKRRSSGSSRSSVSSTSSYERGMQQVVEAPVACLPPPAKWSPAGDEPIQQRNRNSGQYVAVQPAATVPFSLPLAPLYAPQFQAWPVPPMGPPAVHGGFMYVAQPHAAAYHPYAVLAAPTSHARSHSLSYDQENASRHHSRSHSQARFQYQCSNVRTSAQPDSQWSVPESYGYAGAYRQALGPHAPVNYQPNWLRT